MRDATGVTGTFHTHYNTHTGESFLTVKFTEGENPREVLHAFADGRLVFYGPFGEELLTLNFLKDEPWNTEQINTLLDEAWQQKNMGIAAEAAYRTTLHDLVAYAQQLRQNEEEEVYEAPSIRTLQ